MAETTTTSEDILKYHIAPRLPAKCVFRLTMLSMEFYFFVKSQKFANMHFPLVINDHYQSHHQKLLVLSRSNHGTLFGTVDCETPADPDARGLTPPSRTMPFAALTHTYVTILASCHGMVCFGIRRHSDFHDMVVNYINILLWNPATSDYKILSKTNFDIESPARSIDKLGFGLYYSSFDDDYKLVVVASISKPGSTVVVNYEINMYSLRSDSWRKFVDSEPQSGELRNQFQQWASPCVSFNGSIYFLRIFPNYIIMKFDVKNSRLEFYQRFDEILS